MFDTQTTYSCMSSGPMYPNPHSLPSCSMVSKACPAPEIMARDDHKTSEHIRQVVDMDFDESFDEEDDFSDDECEMEAFNSVVATDSKEEPNVTTQLLQFAEMVNGDIQKYFGRKKGEEDSCDIYEDKWTSRKSGRELYYADLLRVAQGDDGEDKRRTEEKKDSSSSNKETYSGRMDTSVGLGPLQELFERSVKEYQSVDCKDDKPTSGPLSGRKLPDSFWTEPTTSANAKTKDGPPPNDSPAKLDKAQPGQQQSDGLLSQSKAPDFTDLLESWTGEDAGGQLGSGDLGQSGVITQETNSRR